MVTFGPMRQSMPIFAVGCTNTLPTIVRFSAGELYNFDELRCRSEFRYRHMPTGEKEDFRAFLEDIFGKLT